MTPYVWRPLPGLDEETLRELYERRGMSVREMSEHLGRTRNTIKKHFQMFGIQIMPQEYIDRPDIATEEIHDWFQAVLEASGVERIDSESGYPLEMLPTTFDQIIMHPSQKEMFNISKPVLNSKNVFEMRILVTLFRPELVRGEITMKGLRHTTSFVQAFTRFYPEEALPYLADNLWRFKRPTREKLMPVGITSDFQLSNGRPNYHLVYPILKLIHERWTQHLGRPLTCEDLYESPRISVQDGEYEGQLGLLDMEWFPKEVWYPLFEQLKRHTGAYYTPVEDAIGITNEKYYRFYRDMERFFVRRGEQGRFEDSEWNTYDYLIAHNHKFAARENFLWRRLDVLRDWFVRGLGGHHGELMHESWENFPESASRRLLNKVENMRIAMLRHIPFYQQAAAGVSYNTPNMTSLNPSILHFVTLLWPDFDWDYIKLERNIGSEDFLKEHLIHFTDDDTVVLTKTIDCRLWKPNGSRLHYPPNEHTERPGPMSFDIMLPKYGIIFELQGGQHYDEGAFEGGRFSAEERDDFIVYSQDLATRQFHDRTKKAYAYRRGWLTIYVPCAPNARPVKGVHGPLSCWNFNMTNEKTIHSDRRNTYGYPYEGLLELIETQVSNWRKPDHVQRGTALLAELRANYEQHSPSYGEEA